MLRVSLLVSSVSDLLIISPTTVLWLSIVGLLLTGRIFCCCISVHTTVFSVVLSLSPVHLINYIIEVTVSFAGQLATAKPICIDPPRIIMLRYVLVVYFLIEIT
jgi:hypothetical protein